MPSFLRMPFRAGVCLVLVTALGAAMVVGTTGQEPAPSPPALPGCSLLDALGIPMQINLRASTAMVACGRALPGGAVEVSGSGESLVGSNVLVGTSPTASTRVSTIKTHT